MNTLHLIRVHVFKVSQAEMGLLAGVAQSIVSRWETGQLQPRLKTMARIRAAAITRGLTWDDGWFFEAPKEAA